VPFLVAGAKYCGYQQYGAVGRLVAASSSSLLQTLQPLLDGFNPEAPFVLFGGGESTGAGDVANFYVLHKATGAVVPALVGVVNETNTDVVCEMRAPIPCGPDYVYANYEPGSVGMPTCVRAVTETMTREAAISVCGVDKSEPQLNHLLILNGVDVGRVVGPLLPPGFMSWTAARVSSATSLQAIPLSYTWQDGSVFSGPLFNETAVVDALVESGGSPADIGVVWSPLYGLQAVDIRNLGGLGFGAVCQTDIPFRIVPIPWMPTLTGRGLLLGYVSNADAFGRYVCPVNFASNGGRVVCRQMGYSTGRMIEPGDGVDDYNRMGLDMSLCRGIGCFGTETSLAQCGSNFAAVCCESPRVVYVDCVA
jgi:hypothetical protein